MANSFGDPIILDTVYTDSAYDKTHDGKYTATTPQYYCQKIKISRIDLVDTANGDTVLINTIHNKLTGTFEGEPILKVTVETGDLKKSYPIHKWVSGIGAKTLSNSSKAYVYLE